MKKEQLPTWRIDNFYSFFMSIVIAVFSFAALYFGLSTQIAVLNTKMDNVIAIVQEEKQARVRELQALNEYERRLAIIEGMHQVNR